MKSFVSLLAAMSTFMPRRFHLETDGGQTPPDSACYTSVSMSGARCVVRAKSLRALFITQFFQKRRRNTDNIY